MNFVSKQELLRSAKRGTDSQRVKNLVEGEYYTFAAMSQITGLSIDQVSTKWRHLKRSGRWPITFEMLRGNK